MAASFVSSLRVPRLAWVFALAIVAILPVARAASAPNILLIIGDDMGIETLPCYGKINDPAVMPNLSSLCRQGVRFNNAWSQPVCSPTRATMMTGRYGFRTGVGAAIPSPKSVMSMRPSPPKPPGTHRESSAAEHDETVPGLRSNEFTLAMALKSNKALGYETAAIGKWHLADLNNGGFDHPNRAGFDHFAGDAFGPLPSYFAFPKQVNGKHTAGQVGYADSARVDDAIAWIRARDGRKPWFMWLGFSNPHSPYHLPPVNLLNSSAKNLDPFSDDIINKPYPYFKAMLEAMDTEIGRLLGSMTPEQRANTYVIFIGDNGSTRQVVQPPLNPAHGKGTVYQGGLNVPLLVAGPGIAGGREINALVNSVDMYATVLELATVDIKRAVPGNVIVDSLSFAPLLRKVDAKSPRTFAYSDSFGQGIKTARAIRNMTHKLVVNEGREEFYDLVADAFENKDLLRGGEMSADAKKNYDELKSKLEQLLASNKT